MTGYFRLADGIALLHALALQVVALLGIFSDAAFQRILAPVRSVPARLQDDDRGGIGLYALAVIGLVVIGAAAVLIFTGGVLDAGTDNGAMNDTDPAPEQDPQPVEDGPDNSTENETNSGDEGSENEGPQYATITGSVNVTDLGPAEQGAVGLYNGSSNQFIELHDFENGSEFSFEELSPGHTYELNVESERAPPETLTVTPEPNETIQRELEVGHEFEGAYSYESNWTVAYEEGIVLENGYQAVDSEGNAFSSWDDPAASERYKNLYLARNSGSYTTLGQGEWEALGSGFTVNGTITTHVTRHGLNEIEQRKYVGEATDRRDGDTLYEYRVLTGAEPFNNSGPMRAYVDPETGYVRYIESILSEWPDRRATTDKGWVYNHEGEGIIAIPEDFPLDNLPN